MLILEALARSAPHPSEAKINIRVQMYGEGRAVVLRCSHTSLTLWVPSDADGKSALDAMNEALDNLESMAGVILEKYNESLEQGDFDRIAEDEKYDFESVNQRLWAQKEAEGRGTEAEFLAEKRKQADAAGAAKDAQGKKGKAVKAER